jgi:anti-sigma B factor antagonist
MGFSEQVVGTELRMNWTDEVDARTAHEPYEFAVAAFEEHGITRVVIDLSGLTFADSTALGTLVRINELAGEHGGELVLTRVPERIRSLLNMTGLDQTLTVHGD